MQVEQTARAYRPNVVMLDLEFPSADGWGLVASLHATFVAASTAHHSAADKLRAEQAGIRLYMRKPVHRKTVLRLLEAAREVE